MTEIVQEISEESKRNFQKKVLIYTLGISSFHGIYFGIKTEQFPPGFLSGTPEQILYDGGSLLALLFFPWIVCLPIAFLTFLFKAALKKKKNFLREWIYITAVIGSGMLIYTLQLGAGGYLLP